MQQWRKYSKLLLSLTFCEIRILDFLILICELACDCDSCIFKMCIVPLDEELGAINKWTLWSSADCELFIYFKMNTTLTANIRPHTAAVVFCF